jgi:hypothetical protein
MDNVGSLGCKLWVMSFICSISGWHAYCRDLSALQWLGKSNSIIRGPLTQFTSGWSGKGLCPPQTLPSSCTVSNCQYRVTPTFHVVRYIAFEKAGIIEMHLGEERETENKSYRYCTLCSYEQPWVGSYLIQIQSN